MFCPKCGAQNPDGAKFCSGCGGPLPASSASPAPAASSPAASPAATKPKRLKMPVVAGIAAIAIAVIVTFVVIFAPSASAPVKTIHFGYGYSTSDGSYDYSNGFCFSTDGDSFALALGDRTVTGKVASSYETDDLTVWEVSPDDASGDSEGGGSVDGVRVALYAPKGASVGNPIGDWGITVINEDSYRMFGRDVRRCQQYKLAVDQDGTYSFQYGSTAIEADDVLDSFESDPAELVDSSSLSSYSGTWAKTDKAGQYSMSFNDDEGTSGILELTDRAFGDLSEYYPDTPKATLSD